MSYQLRPFHLFIIYLAKIMKYLKLSKQPFTIANMLCLFLHNFSHVHYEYIDTRLFTKTPQ